MTVDNDEKKHLHTKALYRLWYLLLKGWLKTGKVNTIVCQLQGDLP